MLLFGHIGITLGAAVLATGLATRSRSAGSRRSEVTTRCLHSSPELSTLDCSDTNRLSWIRSLASFLDIRLLAVGSLLPDIIDKPVGQWLFRDTFSNGRLFTHTLLFLILICVAGLYLYRSGKRTWLLALSFGTFTHLVFDEMWRAPRTLLWPIYGFTFDRIDLTGWAGSMLHALLTDPPTWVTELAGAAVLFWFAFVLLRSRGVFAFIKYGRVVQSEGAVFLARRRDVAAEK